MKAETKQEIASWLFVVLVILTFFVSRHYVNKAEWTETVTGTIIAKSDDTVKSGKYSQRSRFLFAMNYNDRPSDTIEVELHTFITKSVGEQYAYYIHHRADRGWGVVSLFAMIISGVIICFGVLFTIVACIRKYMTEDDK